jgi:uncharacterized metal-binding protein YceD (DUF177 family)
MTPDTGPEFSRLVEIARLPAHRSIEATGDERAALARRFGLLALDRLIAEASLARMPGEAVRLEASFEADFVQECVVTLDPVPARIAERFAIVYSPEIEDPELVQIDEADAETLEGGAVDIGEAVAQQLSLALDPYPHAPGAVLPEAALTEREKAAHPFAALARLRPAGKAPSDEGA